MMGTLGLVFFISFLIHGSINRCSGGLIEYSSFSDYDIMLEMQIFNELDEDFNECLKINHESFEYRHGLRMFEDQQQWNPEGLYEPLRTEILCILIKGYYEDETKYDRKDLARYFGFWATQLLAAEYSLTFIKGYIENETNNPELAQDCLYLARYLAMFPGEFYIREEFFKRVAEIIKNFVENSEHVAYLTAFKVSHIYEEVVDKIRLWIINEYNYRKDTFNKSMVSDEEKMNILKTELSISKLYFINTIFGQRRYWQFADIGGKVSNKSKSQFTNDALVWQNVRLLTKIHGIGKKQTGEYELRILNPTFINLLKSAENYQKGNVYIPQDEDVWKLAGEFKAWIDSGASSSANTGRFESTLLKIIRKLEAQRALANYQGTEKSFEESLLGFKDGSALILEPNSDYSDEDSIIFHLAKN